MSGPKVPPENIARKDYVSAAEAMKLLNIRKQTLYAYVSRGWIRSMPQPGKKDRLYMRDDLQRLIIRSRARSGDGAVAASTMNWGEPIIPTSITEITADGPRYRGKLAADLVRMRVPFESVAELLWTGLWHEEPLDWHAAKMSAETKKLAESIDGLNTSDQIIELFALVTLHLGVGRGTVADRIRNGRTVDAAREIIHTLVGCCGLASETNRYVPMQRGDSVADGLMRAMAIQDTSQNRLAVEAILTLLADHELSPGAFTARIAASSGGTLHSCIAAALCASSGLEIGRLYTRIDDFLKGGTRAVLVQKAVQMQERGLAVPGFAHPLYPQGDPRATLLLEIARQRTDGSRWLSAVFGFLEEMRERFSLLPRQELGVVVLARELGLTRMAPGALFVLARTAGWVAHVQEQRLTGGLLRPRAKFTGMSQLPPSA